VARLLWRHGRGDLVKRAGLEEALASDDGEGEAARAEARELARDLEKMGPTFIKLGQLLSTRADLLPLPYLEPLTRLQDHVAPVPFDEIVLTIETELAAPLPSVFARFDAKPLASASLGQVHRAELLGGGLVAVKVQRPDIRAQVTEDLAALRDVAGFIDAHTEWGKKHGAVAVLEEFRRSLVDELDYRLEARNLATLAENLANFERILVPAPVPELTTSRVLTMDYVRGRKISPVALLGRREIDGHELAEELFSAYLQQILVDGFFHADPHPGNVFLTEDGRIALLDLGMVARVAPRMQERLLQLLLALGEGRGDDAAGLALRIGVQRDDLDEPAFRRRVADLVMRNAGSSLAGVQIGRIVLEATQISGDCGVNAPRELTMLGKALLNLDQVGRVLAPDFDSNAAVRRHAAELMRRRMTKTLSPGNFFSGLLEMKDFATRLPRRVNRILDNVAENNLELKVDAIDEERLIAGIHKVANRITVGLILAALIVAAAMLARVPARPEVLGYPAIAILLFLVAAGGGLALVVSIMINDRRR